MEEMHDVISAYVPRTANFQKEWIYLSIYH